MRRYWVMAGVMGLALGLGGCGGGISLFGGDDKPVAGPPREDVFTPFDTDKDGLIQRSEIDAGVSLLFKADDRNGDGFLDGTEVRAVNDRLIAESGSSTTPVIDWNADGRVTAQEYGAQWRTLFQRVDIDADGIIDGRERAGRVKERKARPLPEPTFGGYRGPQIVEPGN
jgi:hypothetical protein